MGLVNSGNGGVVCEHSCTDHLFRSPMCSQTSLLKRIAILIFHIVTLCIPLAVYFLIAYCCPSKRPSEITPPKPLPLPDKKTLPRNTLVQPQHGGVAGQPDQPPVVVPGAGHEDGNVSSAEEDDEDDQVLHPDQQPQHVGVAGQPDQPPVAAPEVVHEDGNVSSAEEDDEDDQVLHPDQQPQHGGGVAGQPVLQFPMLIDRAVSLPDLDGSGVWRRDGLIAMNMDRRVLSDSNLKGLRFGGLMLSVRGEIALAEARAALDDMLYDGQGGDDAEKVQAAQSYTFYVEGDQEEDGEGLCPPINKEVACFGQICMLKHQEWLTLHKLISKEKGNPWDNEQLLQATDLLIKLYYSMMILMLGDLEEFVDDVKKEDLTQEAVLCSPSYYYKNVFLKFASLYHSVRNGYRFERSEEIVVVTNRTWKSLRSGTEAAAVTDDQQRTFEDDDLESLDGEFKLLKTAEISDPFYMEDKLQYEWRQLYNEMCSRIRCVLEVDALLPNFRSWHVKDLNAGDYRHPSKD